MRRVIATEASAASAEDRDRGAILLLTLALCVLLAIVAVSLATYAAVGLRTSGVTDRRTERLAAVDAGLRAGIEVLKQDPGQCGESVTHPVTIAVGTVSVKCFAHGSQTSAWGSYRITSEVTIAGRTATGVADLQGRTSSYRACTAGVRCLLIVNSWAVAA